jgi:hypothetical protein
VLWFIISREIQNLEMDCINFVLLSIRFASVRGKTSGYQTGQQHTNCKSIVLGQNRFGRASEKKSPRHVGTAREHLCHILVVWLVLMALGVDYVVSDKRGRVIRKYDHHFVNPIVANRKTSDAKAVHDEQTSYRRYHDNDLFVTQTTNRIKFPNYAAIFPSVVPNPTTVEERLDLNLERNAMPDDSNHSSNTAPRKSIFLYDEISVYK